MKRWIVIFFVLVSIVANGQNEEKDFYIWNTNAFQGKISNKLSLLIDNKTHFNIRDKQTALYYSEAIVKYSMNKNFKVGTGYRKLFLRSSSEWLTENRLMSYLWYSCSKNKLKYTAINRLSYRQLENQQNHFRFFHKSILTQTVEIGNYKIHPFIADEIFIKLNQENLHIERLFGGLRFWENKKIKLDVYYAQSFQKNSEKLWSNYPIAGANILISL
jgi:hypothetical protein